MRLSIAIMLLFQYSWDILYTMHPKSFIYEKKKHIKNFNIIQKLKKTVSNIFNSNFLFKYRFYFS